MPEAFDDDQTDDTRETKFNSLYHQGLEQRHSSPEAAIDLFQQALALRPEHLGALQACGRLCIDSERWREGADCYRIITRINASDCSAWIDLGFCLDPLGDLQGAYDAYTRASEVDESDAIGLNNRGYLEMNRGRLSHALADVDAALARVPSEGIALATKAEILSQLGRFDEAFTALEAAIEAEEEWLETAEKSPFLDGLRSQPSWDAWFERIQRRFGDDEG
jgi:tetratricopeptide (TPR) repeat protein